MIPLNKNGTSETSKLKSKDNKHKNGSIDRTNLDSGQKPFKQDRNIIALVFIFGYQKSGKYRSLPGTYKDLGKVLEWTKARKYNIYLATDCSPQNRSDEKIKNLYNHMTIRDDKRSVIDKKSNGTGNEFIISESLMRDIKNCDGLLFFFSGHGSRGRFCVRDSLDQLDLELDIEACIKYLESNTICNSLYILDCCEIKYSIPATRKSIILGSSSQDEKAYTNHAGSPFIDTLLLLFKHRNCRNLSLVIDALQKQYPHTFLCTNRVFLHGWVVPGTYVEIDEDTHRVWYINGNRHKLIYIN